MCVYVLGVGQDEGGLTWLRARVRGSHDLGRARPGLMGQTVCTLAIIIVLVAMCVCVCVCFHVCACINAPLPPYARLDQQAGAEIKVKHDR